jgi:hypothetical protein
MGLLGSKNSKRAELAANSIIAVQSVMIADDQARF